LTFSNYSILYVNNYNSLLFYTLKERAIRQKQLSFLNTMIKLFHPRDDYLLLDGEMRPLHEANRWFWLLRTTGGEGRGRAAATRRAYAYTLADFYRYCEATGVEPVSDATQDTLTGYLEHTFQRGVRPATVNARAAALEQFYRFLVARDYRVRTPFTVKSYRAPKFGMLRGTMTVERERTNLRYRAPAGSPRFLPRTTLDQFYNALSDPRNRLIAQIMWRTGLRVSEVVSLTTDENHLPRDFDGYIRRNEPFIAVIIGKGSKPRNVRFPPDVLRSIKLYLKIRPKSESSRLFLHEDGTPLAESGIHQAFEAHSRRTGLRVTPHQYRHGYALDRLIELEEAAYQDLKLKGMTTRQGDLAVLLGPVHFQSLMILARELGHASISTTEVYLKFLDYYKGQTHVEHQAYIKKLGEDAEAEE